MALLLEVETYSEIIASLLGLECLLSGKVDCNLKCVLFSLLLKSAAFHAIWCHAACSQATRSNLNLDIGPDALTALVKSC